MHPYRQNRRIIAWLACLAVLLNSLAPAMSHALAAAHGKAIPWAQICSTSGIKFIPLAFYQTTNTDKEQNDDSNPMAMDHCAYCLSHAGSFAITTDVKLALTPINLSYFLPYLFYHAPRPLFTWASSNPRAPPTIS